MRLLVLRHARAAPPSPEGDDAARALTAEGERRFRDAARHIARLVPRPDALLTSPLLRARQTAAILAAAWGDIHPALEPVLSAGSVDRIMAVLENHPRDATVVLVGHEPTVSALVAGFVGAHGEAVAFEPGGAALLEVTSVSRGGGCLVWFLGPDAAAPTGA